MKSPTVAIVIPTHNRPNLLLEAVQSALGECPVDGEVIVVDDGSTLPASTVLCEFDDKRLTVLRQERSGGAAAARNVGVAAASGNLIFFLDDDDLFVNGYVESTVTALKLFPKASFGFAARKSQDRSKQVFNLLSPAKPLRHLVAAASAGLWVRRATFIQVGGFDSNQIVDEDTDLCTRLVANGHWALESGRAGTVVRADHTPATASGAQLTRSTKAATVINCYRRTHDKSACAFTTLSSARWFLATRFVRRAVKTGFTQDARRFIASQKAVTLLVGLWIYFYLKRARHSTF